MVSKRVRHVSDTDFADFLIVESSDGGNTWSIVNLSLTDNGVLNGTECTGSGSTAVCVVVGTNYFTGSPLLYMSTDGGQAWESPSISGIPTLGSFRGAGSTK